MAASNWAKYFGTRRWRVAAEVTGYDEETKVTFDRGRFEVEGEGVFHSPLSSARGRKGVLLQEVDAEHINGPDIPGSRIAVGVVVYRKARREGAVL